MKRALPLLLALLLAAGAAAQDTPQKPDLAEVARGLGLEIVEDPSSLYPLKTTHETIRGKKGTDNLINRYKDLLAREMAFYPKSLIQKLGLKKIVLADELKYGEQKRAGIPDFDNDILHLDVKEGHWSRVYQRAVIHHELFHILDWKKDGRLYGDPEWSKLNPKEFKYGSGGAKERSNDAWQLNDKVAGFLNKYSLSGVEEDKAEVYSHFIVHTDQVLDRAKKDEIVARKVERMKSLVKNFCPDLNDGWWNKIAPSSKKQR